MAGSVEGKSETWVGVAVHAAVLQPAKLAASTAVPNDGAMPCQQHIL